MLSDVIKSEIEQILRGILYEEKTLENIDATLKSIRTKIDDSTPGVLGKNCFVCYLSHDDDTLKFAIVHRENQTEEYVVDVVSMGRAGWDENKIVPVVDPDEQDDLQQNGQTTETP